MKHLFSLLIFFSIASVLSAQQKNSASNKWRVSVKPYLMFPKMKGTTGIGELPDADIDADAADIFHKLKMGAMLYFEVGNDKWAFGSDIIYMKLKQEVSSSRLVNSGNVTAKQFAWELTALRRITPWLEVGIGGLLNSLNMHVDLNTNNVGGGVTNRSRAISKTWVDPMLIARVRNKNDVKFLYNIQGEIGGFGIGSEFAWQVQAYAGYRFSKLFQLTGGYRFIGINYDTGEGADRFKYDMDTFGPVLRLGFDF
ncbi:hypothetical protein [Pollutibacter soli]|uniref:hypothetical protein n=1 Tax=Pollutibacter soli TaxID=3034157 RepID=UPI00301387DB